MGTDKGNKNNPEGMEPNGGSSYRTKRIAVVSTYVDGYIFSRLMRGIENVLSENEYAIQMSFTNNSPTRERKALELLVKTGDIDGLITQTSCGALPSRNVDLYRELQKMGIPIIFFDSIYPELKGRIPLITPDDRAIGRDAAKFLIDAGHTKIGAMFKLDDIQGHLRYAGYQDAMMEAGLEVDTRRIIWYDSYSSNNLDNRWEEISDRLHGCTAIECYNDEVGGTLEKLLIDKGFGVPYDISLVGVDDAPINRDLPVPLTTFSHPKEELGRRVAETLLDMIENKTTPEDFYYPPEPVIRESIKKIS
ncbi:MAG: substrate-binding domain-containing protein [Lachnospiraceae bacterium]|nr:substrate-binding domain-containing protein [Lachnospiraceae bacterium]